MDFWMYFPKVLYKVLKHFLYLVIIFQFKKKPKVNNSFVTEVYCRTPQRSLLFFPFACRSQGTQLQRTGHLRWLISTPTSPSMRNRTSGSELFSFSLSNVLKSASIKIKGGNQRSNHHSLWWVSRVIKTKKNCYHEETVGEFIYCLNCLCSSTTGPRVHPLPVVF